MVEYSRQEVTCHMVTSHWSENGGKMKASHWPEMAGKIEGCYWLTKQEMELLKTNKHSSKLISLFGQTGIKGRFWNFRASRPDCSRQEMDSLRRF